MTKDKYSDYFLSIYKLQNVFLFCTSIPIKPRIFGFNRSLSCGCSAAARLQFCPRLLDADGYSGVKYFWGWWWEGGGTSESFAVVNCQTKSHFTRYCSVWWWAKGNVRGCSGRRFPKCTPDPGAVWENKTITRRDQRVGKLRWRLFLLVLLC